MEVNVTNKSDENLSWDSIGKENLAFETLNSTASVHQLNTLHAILQEIGKGSGIANITWDDVESVGSELPDFHTLDIPELKKWIYLPLNPTEIVYITLMTSDSFLMGIQALVHSLQQTRTAFPIVVMHTSQVSDRVVRKVNELGDQVNGESTVKTLHVNALPNPMDDKDVHVPGWVNAGFSKLQILNQTQYKKLVYVDADALVLENVDEFAAAPDVFPPDRLNAGILVVEPNPALFRDMMSKAHSSCSYDGGDTGFLNLYFTNWFQSGAVHRLPFGYNAQRTMFWKCVHDKQPGYWKAIKPLKILHFSSTPKPWEQTTKKGELEILWWNYYIASNMKSMLNV